MHQNLREPLQRRGVLSARRALFAACLGTAVPLALSGAKSHLARTRLGFPRPRRSQIHATMGPDWSTIKAHQDIVRKQRTRDRAAFLAATSSLPPRMARHAAMQAVAEDRATSAAKSAMPAVRTGITDKNGAVEGITVVGHMEIEPEDIVREMRRRHDRQVYERHRGGKPVEIDGAYSG